MGKKTPKAGTKNTEYFKTGIEGFDTLFQNGIPTGSNVLLSGGAGSGKTILGLQILKNAAKQGKKCLFMSFEESEERLLGHMKNFKWKPETFEKNMIVKRMDIFDISRKLDAMDAKAKGELLIDVKPVIFPGDFVPEVLVIDSITAVASAFSGEQNYRSYIENLFRYLESLKITTFVISETRQVPDVFSPTGIEEFLADGVIILYNVRKGDIRENAIEVLKMRGSSHVKKVVAMRVTDGGIEIYPDQEVFGGLKSE